MGWRRTIGQRNLDLVRTSLTSKRGKKEVMVECFYEIKGKKELEMSQDNAKKDKKEGLFEKQWRDF